MSLYFCAIKINIDNNRFFILDNCYIPTYSIGMRNVLMIFDDFFFDASLLKYNLFFEMAVGKYHKKTLSILS